MGRGGSEREKGRKGEGRGEGAGRKVGKERGEEGARRERTGTDRRDMLERGREGIQRGEGV